MKSTSNITFRFNRLLLIPLIIAQHDSYTFKEHQHSLNLSVHITVYTAVCSWMDCLFSLFGQSLPVAPITKVALSPPQSLCLNPLNISPSLWSSKKTNASKISWPWGVDHYQHLLLPPHVYSLFFHQFYGYKFLVQLKWDNIWTYNHIHLRNFEILRKILSCLIW